MCCLLQSWLCIIHEVLCAALINSNVLQKKERSPMQSKPETPTLTLTLNERLYKSAVSMIFTRQSWRYGKEMISVLQSLSLFASLVSVWLAVRLTRPPPSRWMAYSWFVSPPVRLPARWAACLLGGQFDCLNHFVFHCFTRNTTHAWVCSGRTHSLFWFYLVSISQVGQLTLKKPFDFDHTSISAPLGT